MANLDLDASLQYTNDIRERLINKLMSKEKLDKTSSEMLTTLLNGMDTSVISRERLSLQRKDVNNGEELNNLIGKVLMDLSTGKGTEGLPQVVDDRLINDDYNPGELSEEPELLDYNTFVK